MYKCFTQKQTKHLQRGLDHHMAMEHGFGPKGKE